MPFTARDLRYHPEESYPLLYAYLHRNAQRFLGSLKYDAYEVDTVIGHVVEQLVRLGLLGGEDCTPHTALDQLSDAQFYAFLSRSVRNKAIDRLRKRRLLVSAASELESPLGEEGEGSLLEGAVESVWGTIPFASPEDLMLHLVSQQDLRNLLKHCIMVLSAAPNQLQAVIQEMHEFGADELLQNVIEELHITVSNTSNPHISQHKDHAHKKLRNCLQQQSTNLTVTVALRLTMYTERSTTTKDYSVDVQTLAQKDLSQEDVRKGLQGLVTEGLLDWQGEEAVRLTESQKKRLTRFYKEE